MWAGACLKDRFLFITFQQQPGRLATKLDGGRSPASPRVRPSTEGGLARDREVIIHGWVSEELKFEIRVMRRQDLQGSFIRASETTCASYSQSMWKDFSLSLDLTVSSRQDFRV